MKVIQEPDFSECDALVVANLDVLPANPDMEYARLCQNTFRYLEEDIKMNNRIKIVFGRNNR